MKYETLNGTYVFGDIHQKVERVERFLSRHKPNRVIWLGDYFDDFGDTPEQAGRMARYLKHLIDARPQDTFLLGNHDISYLLGDECKEFDQFHSYGYTHDKNKQIQRHFPRDYWRKLKLYHVQDNVVFSHAGMHGNFSSTVSISLVYRDGLDYLLDKKFTYYDLTLLGNMNGPLWIRDRLTVNNNFCQVFGHTHYDLPVIKYGFQTWNVNLDCSHNFCGVFREDHFNKISLHQGIESAMLKYE